MMRKFSVLLLFCCVQSAAAQTEHYLMIFAAEEIPYRATRAHTFAAMVSVENVEGKPIRMLERHSLSWLPATMNVRGLALRPELGRNLPLDETLRHYLDAGGRVCMWGPYRIQHELAETFKARVAAVECTFDYKGACLLSPRYVCDCARSVEEMVPTHRRYIGLYGYGAAAASVVVQKLSPWFVEPGECHPFAATMIGLDEYPIYRRAFGDFSTRWDQINASLRRK